MESVNELLKLFMRQAGLERAAKRPVDAQDIAKRPPGAGTRLIARADAASHTRPDEPTAA